MGSYIFNRPSTAPFVPKASVAIQRRQLGVDTYSTALWTVDQLQVNSTATINSLSVTSGVIASSGTINKFNSTAVTIAGGKISNTPIGATAPSSGDFTALKATSFASSNVNITGGSISGVAISGSSFSSTNVAISGGYISGTPIGATNASSGNFTALDASSNFTGVHISLTSGMNATTGLFTGGVTASSAAFTNSITASSATITNTMAANAVAATSAVSGQTVAASSALTGSSGGVTNGWTASSAAFTNGMTASSGAFSAGVAVTSAISASSAAFTNGMTASSATFTNAVAVGYIANAAPVTKTANFTLAATENWVINNKASACVVTLPAASGFTGREVTFQNYQDFTLTSIASDVVPLGGGAAGTSILPAVAGSWATVVSNGTNWVIMRSTPNNILLLS